MDTQELLQKSLDANGLAINKDIFCSILDYIKLIQEWNSRINLTAHRKIEDLIEKDIIDSLYLNKFILKYVKEPSCLIDLGAGAGFSGMILSLMNPSLEAVFLDSNRKKVNFIREVIRSLQIKKAGFLQIRAEDEPEAWRAKFDLCVSRATWKPEILIGISKFYLKPNGVLAVMGGAKEVSITDDALQTYNLRMLERGDYIIHPNQYTRKIFFFRSL